MGKIDFPKVVGVGGGERGRVGEYMEGKPGSCVEDEPAQVLEECIIGPEWGAGLHAPNRFQEEVSIVGVGSAS